MNSENKLERDTELLSESFIRVEIQILFSLSSLQLRKDYEGSLAQIEKYKQLLLDNGFEFQKSKMNEELTWQEAFAHIGLRDYQKGEELLLGVLARKRTSQLRQSEGESEGYIAIRVYTQLILLLVNGYATKINQKECLRKLIQLLKKPHQLKYLPEVVGKLTGCTHLHLLHKKISFPNQDEPKRAAKLQIFAHWKFMVSLDSEAKSYKLQALKVWKKLNRLQQYEKCNEEYEQMNGKKKGPFLQKMLRIKYFVKELKMVEPGVEPVYQSIYFRNMFAEYVDEIERKQEKQEELKKSLSFQSKVKKEEGLDKKLGEYLNEIKQFDGKLKKQKVNEISSLLFNSKLINSQYLVFRKKMGIFNKIKSLRMRYVMNQLKLIYQKQKEKHLKKSVLRSMINQ